MRKNEMWRRQIPVEKHLSGPDRQHPRVGVIITKWRIWIKGRKQSCDRNGMPYPKAKESRATATLLFIFHCFLSFFFLLYSISLFSSLQISQLPTTTFLHNYPISF